MLFCLTTGRLSYTMYMQGTLLRTPCQKNMNKQKKVYISSKILSPRDFSGSVHGDYGYEINGVKSDKGYISRSSAQKALDRRIEKDYDVNSK